MGFLSNFSGPFSVPRLWGFDTTSTTVSSTCSTKTKTNGSSIWDFVLHRQFSRVGFRKNTVPCGTMRYLGIAATLSQHLIIIFHWFYIVRIPNLWDTLTRRRVVDEFKYVHSVIHAFEEAGRPDSIHNLDRKNIFNSVRPLFMGHIGTRYFSVFADKRNMIRKRRETQREVLAIRNALQS